MEYTLEELSNSFRLSSSPNFLEHIESLVIKCGSKRIAFSKVCYLDYKVKRGRPWRVLVNLKSLDPDRVEIAHYLVKYVHELLEDGIRPTTLGTRLPIILDFFKYLNYQNLIIKNDRNSISNAVAHYSDNLLHQIRISSRDKKIGLTSGTAHNYQHWVVTFFSYILNVQTYSLLPPELKIKTNYKERVLTETLSDSDYERDFNQYTSIFRQLCKVVLDHKRFPVNFNINGQDYVITPYGLIRKKNFSYKAEKNAFCFFTGREFSDKEIAANKKFKNTSKRNEVIKVTKHKKEISNQFNSKTRTNIALLACKAYFMHFLFLTGENDSTAASVLFDGSFETCNAEAHFKSIKWRAKNKTVTYNIQYEFINDFKEYLKLRSYILSTTDKQIETLFLSTHSNKVIPPPTNGVFSSQIKSSFKEYYFSKNKFSATSKTIRFQKSLWTRSKFGDSIASYVLQHNKTSSTSYYTDQNPQKCNDEFNEYFDTIHRQLTSSEDSVTQTPTGICRDINKPLPSTKDSPLIPSCSDFKTCLNCKNYRVHSDENDIRKLLSLQYLIQISQSLSCSTEHYNQIYSEPLNTIESVLNQMIAIDKQMEKIILEIKSQVFEEEKLSEYWYRKLELLNELGAI